MCLGGLDTSESLFLQSHSDSLSVCEESFGSYLCSWLAIFKIIIIPNNGAHTGTEMGHKWITYFLFVF